MFDAYQAEVTKYTFIFFIKILVSLLGMLKLLFQTYWLTSRDPQFLNSWLLIAGSPPVILLSATNHAVYSGPPATADSASTAIWAGTENTADFSLALEPQMCH